MYLGLPNQSHSRVLNSQDVKNYLKWPNCFPEMKRPLTLREDTFVCVYKCSPSQAVTPEHEYTAILIRDGNINVL